MHDNFTPRGFLQGLLRDNIDLARDVVVELLADWCHANLTAEQRKQLNDRFILPLTAMISEFSIALQAEEVEDE